MRIPSVNENTSKSLTSEQINLIESNYKEVKKVLSSIFKNRTKTYEALSYLPEAARTFNTKYNVRFAKYAYNICYRRSIDEFRKLNKRSENKYSLETVRNHIVFNSDINLLEWEDAKDNILDRAEYYFHSDNKKIGNIYKCIVQEYLVPMADGDQNTTITKIAKKYNMSKSTICQMIKSPKMKEFIRTCV
jgi:hypothetical protein